MPSTVPAPARRSERLALAALLAGTALVYLWNLSANGWANSFYAAAVQSGTKSWTAFLFGSSDWGNSITVDKTPAALWPMELSARLFGFSGWSMLLPQVLLGVGSVALLWVIVRGRFGPAAGFVAGLVLAVTPVAALMFRFNNPDALLVFLMLAACWALLRAVADDRVRWLVLCGVLVGLGFLAKQLQVMLVLPALVVTYLMAARGGIPRRVARLFAAAGGLVLGAGWWLLIAVLRPAGSRPYFGGSQHNSTIELALGYNGLDRLGNFGTVEPGRPPGGGPFGRAPGIGRLFDASVGGQIAWFVPAAVVLVVVGIVLCGRAERGDPRRAALVLFGVWGLVTGVVFSFMHGIFHEYYTVALAPALAGAIGAGGVLGWRSRDVVWVRVALGVAVLSTGVTAFVLLGRAEGFVPWLRWVVVAATVLGVVGVLGGFRRRAAVVATVAAVAVGGLAGPVAYVLQTVSSPHRGGIVLAGPNTGGGFPGPPSGGGPDGAPLGMPGSAGVPFGGPGAPSGGPEWTGGPGGGPEWTGAPGGAPGPDAGGPASGAAPNQAAQHDPGRRGPMGAPPDPLVIAKLRADAGNFRWPAATVASMTAADYQLAADVPVMPIGGFSGGDPSPTLAAFQAYVADGDIHWFLATGPGRNRDSEGTRITEWVRDTFTPIQLGDVTLYDLTAPK
ncbi:glycosyltransferase family 39 protein [Nocardia asteroides]|uniref:glycosyltransferase family 39 protein n=1 Tax=Nocardia asteroides TaxID=1824 RepID=UPI001E33AD11|nr:glycosyltransferase family 39 protein [Nocardia asteroides]UGT62441.1 glycosyltransferase family 39 protein [Nocardia asteroides]